MKTKTNATNVEFTKQGALIQKLDLTGLIKAMVTKMDKEDKDPKHVNQVKQG